MSQYGRPTAGLRQAYGRPTAGLRQAYGRPTPECLTKVGMLAVLRSANHEPLNHEPINIVCCGYWFSVVTQIAIATCLGSLFCQLGSQVTLVPLQQRTGVMLQ